MVGPVLNSDNPEMEPLEPEDFDPGLIDPGPDAEPILT